MFIVSGVWIGISAKNSLETFINDARIRLEEKYQRTVQIDRYTSDYHGAEAVQVRFADEPEVEFSLGKTTIHILKRIWRGMQRGC